MGGKGKHTQRTKGNVRPSSSGRTAELLENVGGFVGFSGITEPTFVPIFNTATTSDEADLAIQPDFRISMRKMSKKDVVTKVKALQEFVSLCSSHPLEDLLSALPFWPRLYNKLAVESDRRVREAAQKAHQTIVSIIGRKIAPHLKSLIGVWFTSQDDNYAPAATVAQCSFKSTFLNKKEMEAVSMYQSEILLYIEDNLNNLTMQTVGDPKASPVEELEAKFERIFFGCLAGYARLLQLLPEEEIKKCDTVHNRICGSAKFWGLVGRSSNVPCKTPSLRQAYFSLLSSLVAHFPTVFEQQGLKAKLCPQVFGFMDETDSIVLPVVWDAVLHVVAKIPDCWTYVNPTKVVLPKLFAVLKAGGHGNATQVYHSILPLLSHLPEEVRGDDLKFYISFFENYRTGLSLPTVKRTSSDAAAIMTSFVECLRYVIKTKPELKEMCIKEQVFPVLKLVFADLDYRFPAPLFQALNQALRSWTKDDATTRQIFLEELEILVFNIVNFLVDELTSPKANLGKIPHQTELLTSLFRNLTSQRGRSASKSSSSPKVRFADGPEHSSSAEASSTNTYDAELAKMAIKVVQQLLPSIANHVAPLGMTLIADLLTDVGLSTSLSLLYPNVGISESVELFLRNYALSWLRKPKLHHASLFSLTLALIRFLNREKKTGILSEFLQGLEPEVTCQFLTIAYPGLASDNAFESWIRSSETKTFLMRIPYRLSTRENRNDDIYWKLARVLLNDGVGIPSDTACELLREFEKSLTIMQGKEKASNKVEHFVSSFNDILVGGNQVWMSSAEGRRIANAFLSMATTRSLSLSDEVTKNLLETWRLCVRHSLGMSGESEMITLVKSHIESCQPEELPTMLEIVVSLLETVSAEVEGEERSSLESEDLLQSVCRVLLPTEEEWKKWRVGENVVGFLLMFEDKLTTPIMPELVQWDDETDKSNLLKRLRFADLAQTFFSRFPHLASREENAAVFTEVVYTAAVYDVLSRTARNLIKEEESMDFTLKTSLLESNRSLVSKAVFEKAKTEGFAWSWSLHLLLAEGIVNAKILDISTSDEMSLGLLHTLQIIANDLPEVKLNLLGEEAPRVMAFSQPEKPFDAAEWKQIHFHLALCNSSVELSLKDTDSLKSAWDNYLSIIADTLMHWHQVKGDGMLFSGIASQTDCDAVAMVTEIIRFMRILVDSFWQHLHPPHWDWILCSLASWSLSVEESWQLAFKSFEAKKNFEFLPWLLFYSTSTCDLAKRIVDLVSSAPATDDKTLPENLSTEWNDVFSDSVYNAVASTFVPLGGLWERLEKIPGAGHMVYNFSVLFAAVPKDKLLKLFESRSKSKACDVIVKALCPLLLSRQTALQAAAFEALQKVIPDVDVEEVGNSEENDDKGCPPPTDLLEVLTQVDEVMESICEHADYGNYDRMIVENSIVPAVVSYIYVWRTVLNLCQGSSAEKRSRYVTYLWENNYLQRLFGVLFKIMPANPVLVEEKSTSVAVQFAKDVCLLYKDVATVENVRHLSCLLYLRLLQRLPAVARRWWGELEKRFSMEVDAYTSKYVSPVLCSAELRSVETDERRFDNMKVKVRVSTREIMATYLLDESSLEVSIRLPANYPLGPVTVEGGKRVGVSNSQWRNWMLQLTTFLLNQNGSICDGLELWKRNVDKRFEGVEECYICYYVLHGSNYQLPRLSCRTCKKKFHSACLYKWFNTSNNSTCPLCRNLF